MGEMERSLASADWVIAARCREPSGFLTTLIGDIAMVAFVCGVSIVVSSVVALL